MVSHYERMHAIQAAFLIANHHLAAGVGKLDDARAAQKPADGGWSAAQIAWHVALANERLARILAGEDAGSIVPIPEGFQETSGNIVPRWVEVFPTLAPPDQATRTEAVARLRSSERAVLDALRTVTMDRSSHECVRMPFGTCSLYELGDCIAAHVERSSDQLDRTIAGA